MLSGITFGSKKELEKQFREESQLEQAKKREQRRKEKKVRQSGWDSLGAAGGTAECSHMGVLTAGGPAGDQEA